MLIAALSSYVPRFAPGVSADAVITAGPLDLTSLTSSVSLIEGLRQAWALAVSRVNVFLLVVICVSVPTACGMQWLNIKRISQDREKEKKAITKSRSRDRDAKEEIVVAQEPEVVNKEALDRVQ